MENKKNLWLRLRSYRFEHLAPPHLQDRVRAAFGGPDASTRAFADKLARKLKWSVPFALRAIDEYRKFVYLGLVADFPVTPPRVLDQVWHEHLLFTRAYREFCESVLRREFDHHPELVPLDEQTAVFQAQYQATRELYRTEFDHEPPAEFWGVPKFADRPEPATLQKLRRKDPATVATSGDDTPLYMMFGDPGAGAGAHSTLPEFSGGSSGGGGGGTSWPDSGSHAGHGGHGGHGDSGGGHDGGHGGDGGGGHGGGDAGGGDGGGGDGGSGCSSGCGGGCGGG